MKPLPNLPYLFIFLSLISLQSVTSQEETISTETSSPPTTTPTPAASPSSSVTTISTSSVTSPASSTPTPHISDAELHKIARIFKVNQKKLPVLKKLGRKINSLLDRVEASDGHLRPELLVHEFLPDPLPVKDIEINNEEGYFTWYKGKFTKVKLHGISGVKIASIKANVGKFTAKIFINVPNVYLTGDYDLEGKVTFVDVNGAGQFRMNITDIEIEAFGNLNRTTDPTTGKEALQIGAIELDVSPGDMDIVLDNLSVFGSETVADTIVGTMSGLIFSQIKSTVLEKTSDKIRGRINERLATVPLTLFEGARQETLFDDLLQTVTRKLGQKIEPLRLPELTRNFAARMLIMNVNASVSVTEGKLHGLTTFARTGDIWITYEEDTAIIEADVGFRNLTGGYNWALKVLGRGPSGSASLAIRKISAYMRIRQTLKRGSIPKLEQFRVEAIDHVWMDMNGLGVWDYLLEIVVNTVSNAFRGAIANLVASTVTKVIQEELDKAQISFIP